MYCKKCGKQIENESRFCPQCGEIQTVQTEDKASNENGKKILKDVIGAISEPVSEVMKEILIESVQDTTEAVKKKGKKVTHKGLVKLGLENETLVDKIEKLYKRKKKNK